ncbi:MAG: Rid family detoxifying hydrolase [Saprospiraceae bacterium]|jgi:2-iminobutanoate/2-iminopropanoate deaminase|nr:Rid family detoxifying hydrolase [Saprospiraceae bacterium]MDP4819831.1 Rid family detoxifying hydrolase [Saprospiraceae bacterium]MDP4997511.1 Rid family detoxifying hydrolase [Saprospiraceae bacterium]
MKKIQAPAAPKAIGPYSAAIRVGNLLFCSGQTPVNPDTMLIEGRDIEEQTLRALNNLEIVLSAAGASRENIVKTSVFLKNFADFPKMNAVYADFFGNHKPARTTVEVSRLPLDALVEIECIAEV